MNLSKQSKELIEQLGRSIATLYSLDLTPLQILILVEVRHREALAGKGEHVMANDVRHAIEALYEERGAVKPPTRQSFWTAVDVLRHKRGLLWVAPHKKGTSLRAMRLTALGKRPFEYPPFIHPYQFQN